jgi:hypothetical protein
MHTKFWLEDLKGRRDHLEDLRIYEKTVEWIIGKYGEKCALAASGSS